MKLKKRVRKLERRYTLLMADMTKVCLRLNVMEGKLDPSSKVLRTLERKLLNKAEAMYVHPVELKYPEGMGKVIGFRRPLTRERVREALEDLDMRKQDDYADFYKKMENLDNVPDDPVMWGVDPGDDDQEHSLKQNPYFDQCDCPICRKYRLEALEVTRLVWSEDDLADATAYAMRGALISFGHPQVKIDFMRYIDPESFFALKEMNE